MIEKLLTTVTMLASPQGAVLVGVAALLALFLWAHISHLEPRMKLTDLVLDVGDGRMSLAKTISLVAAVHLSVGFTKEAFARGLAWDDYLGYAVGMAMSASPTLAASVVSLRYGQAATTAPAGEKKP